MLKPGLIMAEKILRTTLLLLALAMLFGAAVAADGDRLKLATTTSLQDSGLLDFIKQKFDEKYSLNFPLLADEDHRTAAAYGAWGERSMYGKKFEGIIRSSFLVDEDGKILGAWYGVKPEDTVPNAIAMLKK